MSHVFDYLDLIKDSLKRSPFGLITDIDGTISKTAPTPQEARISPLCHHYLSILCHHLALVAAVSGRPVVEVKDMVNIDGMVYIGNHGMERWIKGHYQIPKDVQNYAKVIKAVIKELEPILAIAGVWIEDKGVTATIHYRLSPKPESAKRQILATLENSVQAKGLRMMPGKMAIDLLPPVDFDKGTAVSVLIQEYNLQGGIYLGDDVTDITAFQAIHTAHRSSNFEGFALGVTSPEMPEKLIAEADFSLNGVTEVEHFLKWMSQTVAQLG